jgi:hypothetical protein
MRKRKQQRQPRLTKKSTRGAPRTIQQYRAKSERFQDTWNRVTHVVSKMRAEGASLQVASREFALAPRTVIRWGGSALRKRSNGQYAAKASDHLLRVLVIPTREGLLEIAVPDSRQASQLGEYWAAVQKYLETGDASSLRRIRRKTIVDASGKRFRLLKDVGDLERLGSAGVLSFESLYAKAA